MHTINSPKQIETINQIGVLKEVAKTLEKEHQKISLILDQVKAQDISQESFVKFPKSPSLRSKKSSNYFSKLSNNGRVIKGNSFLPEDLTEVTITDVVTEPSDSCQSIICSDKIPKFLQINLHPNLNNQMAYNNNFMLLTPDDSYRNVSKLNQKILQNLISPDEKTSSRNKNFDPIRFPLLRINLNDQSSNIVSSKFLKPQYFEDFLMNNFEKFTNNENRKNMKTVVDFLVSPEVILQDRLIRELNKPNSKVNAITNEEYKRKLEFIGQNLIKVKLDAPFELCEIFNFKNKQSQQKSQSKIHNSNPMINKENIHSIIKQKDKNVTITLSDEEEFENEMTYEKTLDISSNSEVVFHKGYIITSDNVTDSIPNRKEKVLKNNFNKIKEPKIVEKNEIFDTQVELLPKNISIPIQIAQMPVLPPDILGNFNVKNGQNIKKFLGIKSIDGHEWHDIENIDLGCAKNDSRNELKLIVNSDDNLYKTDKVEIDNYTSNVLYPNGSHKKFKRKLNESLKTMDNKIMEMERISSSIGKEFANSKSILLELKKTNLNNQFSEERKQNPEKKLEKALLLVTNCDKESCSEFEVTVISKSSNSTNASEILTLTDDSLLKQKPYTFVPQISLCVSENDMSTNSNVITKVRHPLIRQIKPTVSKYVKQNNQKIRRFRNEIEKNNYFRRKNEGKFLAIQTLNQLGLPPNSSNAISVKLLVHQTPNEMMLSEMKRNEKSLPGQFTESPRFDSSVQTYRPIKQKPFFEKVRLQRPEITRHRNVKKPVTYSENHLSLQPKQNSFTNQKIVPKHKKHTSRPVTLTPRSVISQDTDVLSLFSDWSIPDDVNRMLYNESQHNTGPFIDELSQMVSIQSNTFIDWDQVSEMIKSPTL